MRRVLIEWVVGIGMVGAMTGVVMLINRYPVLQVFMGWIFISTTMASACWLVGLLTLMTFKKDWRPDSGRPRYVSDERKGSICYGTDRRTEGVHGGADGNQ